MLSAFSRWPIIFNFTHGRKFWFSATAHNYSLHKSYFPPEITFSSYMTAPSILTILKSKQCFSMEIRHGAFRLPIT